MRGRAGKVGDEITIKERFDEGLKAKKIWV